MGKDVPFFKFNGSQINEMDENNLDRRCIKSCFVQTSIHYFLLIAFHLYNTFIADKAPRFFTKMAWSWGRKRYILSVVVRDRNKIHKSQTTTSVL